MSKELVISGDDFGMSEAFNIGALRAWSEGSVSVLALMVNLPASLHAVELRNKNAPDAPLALHFNVVLGRSVSDPESISSLVDEDGCFYRSSAWKSDNPENAKCKGNVYPQSEDVARELLAQIARFHDLTGEYPSHIDCHSVVVKPVAEALQDVAKVLEIHCESCPRICPEIMRTCAECMPFGGDTERVQITSRGSTVQDWERDAFGVLECPYDIAVVHAHPGYIDQTLLDNTSLTLPRCRDLQTLTDPRVAAWLESNGIRLVTYEEVYPGGYQAPSHEAVERLKARFCM